MDSLRRIEDDVRNLGIEAKKKYPAVKEATEKSFQTLKQMRDNYVAEVMRKDAKDVNKFRSSDVTAPYYMVCSQPDAPTKLLTMALGGIQLFLDLDAIPPNEAAQVMRIFNIQVSTGKADIQLKVLQMTLQFANLLAQDKMSAQYLTDSIIRDMFAIPLQLCDGKSSVSVAHTAFATASQILGIVMNGVAELLNFPSNSSHKGVFEVNGDQASSSLVLSAQLMIRDLATLTTGKSAQWMRGVLINQTVALDLLQDGLAGWRHLFKYVPLFTNVIKSFVCPAINTLLKRLQADYIAALNSATPAAGSNLVSRIVRTARFILTNFIQPQLVDEIDLMVALMAQSFQATEMEEAVVDEKPTGIDKVFSRFNIPLTTAQILKPQGMLQTTLSNLSIPTPSSRSLSQSSNSDSTPTGNTNVLVLNRPTSTGANANVHAHPAGTCLEAILSFLLMDSFVDKFIEIEGGAAALASIFGACLNCTSLMIFEGLSLESNIGDFETFVKESVQVSIIERVLSGEEADSEHASRQLYEHLLTFGTISSNEVLLLSFQIIQVITRLLAQCAVKVALVDQQGAPTKFFLSPELKAPSLEGTSHAYHPFLFKPEHSVMMRSALLQVCEHCVDPVINACVTILLSGINTPGVIRRTLGIISELAFTSGLVGLQRQREVAISTLCKFSVPQWGREDKQLKSPTSPKPQDGSSSGSLLKWRHLQAFVRLVQVVHVLADTLTDWDVIMDCFEQLSSYILVGSGAKKVEVTPDELDRVIDCIHRFKMYTVHIADDTLVKLMASLVALSLNTLAVSSLSSTNRKNQEPGSKIENNAAMSSSTLAAVMSMGVSNSRGANQGSNYMAEGISRGLVGFSMQAAIEISKINAYRVASVWQMVMSHLRMIASLKSSTLRVVSVAATHDVIASTLEFLLSQADMRTTDDDELHPYMMSTARLTDDILYNLVMPQFETAFDPLKYQRLLLNRRLLNLSDVPKLTQLDLFSSLKSLSSVRFDDVRKGVLFGLRSLLQGKGGGQIKGVGWVTIIELLILVPSSMQNTLEDVVDANAQEDDDNEAAREQWPKATLETAFACMTLIVDDFLEELPDYAILQGICCLASFGAQIIDVNISLTAVELLWKVTDHALSSKNDKEDAKPAGESTVSKIDLLNLTMTHLQTLSKDSRPEIRNCAVRTLFAAIVANSSLLSVESWKFVFDDILFPLFGSTVEKSEKASNETSDAPELKKGVRMALHHSRDTESKQWAETISLELKGFARIMKACTRLLLDEDWFFATWSAAIDIFVTAVRTPTLTEQAEGSCEEVSLAGLDSLMNLLKTSSPSVLVIANAAKIDSGPDNFARRSMKVKDLLWQSAWTAVSNLAAFDEYYFDEFPLRFLTMLSDYYAVEAANEDTSVFHSEATGLATFKSLLSNIVLISRPRRKHKPVSKPTELQTIRNVLSVVKGISPTSITAFLSLLSAIAEICYGVSGCIVKCPFKKVDIYLDAVQPMLRADIGKYLVSLIDFRSEHSAEGNAETIKKRMLDLISSGASEGESDKVEMMKLVCLDIISRRSLADLCENAINRRAAENSTDVQIAPSPVIDAPRKRNLPPRQSSNKFMGGFFSAVGNLLSSEDAQESSELHWSGEHLLGQPLHRFDARPKSQAGEREVWGVFHASAKELEVLSIALKFMMASEYSSDDSAFLMRPIVWSSLMLNILCVGSPWSSSELDRTESISALSEEESASICKHLKGIIDVVTSYALQERFASTAVASFTETLIVVSRLIINKLGMLADTSHVNAQMEMLSVFYQSLLSISQSSVLSSANRQRAMFGVVTVVQELVIALFYGHALHTSHAIRRGAEKFLQLVHTARCPLDVLPTVEASGGSRPSSVHISAWTDCCHQTIVSAAEEWVESVPAKAPSKTSQFTMLQNNHLLLLYPVATRILKSESNEGIVDAPLRHAAAAVLDAVDMQQFTLMLKRLDSRLSQVEAEKVILDEMSYLNV